MRILTRETQAFRRCAVWGTVLVLAGTLAACSEGGSEQGISDEAIKIGLFAPLSGDAAVYGKGQHMIEAIYRDVNDQGGINGRKLDLNIQDSKCDPNTVNIILRKMISQDKVFMINGGMCSDALVAGLPQIERSGIPFMPQGAASSDPTDPPLRNLFATAPVQSDMGADVASFVESTNKTRVAVVSQTDTWGNGWLEPFDQELKKTGSVDVVARLSITNPVGDATPQVRKLLSAKPDVIVAFAYPQPMSALLRDAHEQGLHVPIITANNVDIDSQVDKLGSSTPVESLVTEHCYAKPLTDYSKYKDLLKKYYPNDDFDGTAMLAVSGAQLNIQVLKEMGDDLTWKNWIRTMERVRGSDTDVAPQPIAFSPFEADDPGTRRGTTECNFAKVDTEDPEQLALLKSWDEPIRASDNQ